MRPIGFSTGSLAPGNTRLALEMLRHYRTTAIELSALRTSEVEEVVQVVREVKLEQFQYISFHAPSKWNGMSEREFLNAAAEIIKQGWPIILHPDAIQEWDSWHQLGSQVVIENMDGRKPVGRNVEELQNIFDRLPLARFCFDVGHAKQIDPTMKLAQDLLNAFGSRLSEFHVSDVNEHFAHVRLSRESMQLYGPLLQQFPHVPIILETPVAGEEMTEQLGLL
jgi:hypothetical protein